MGMVQIERRKMWTFRGQSRHKGAMGLFLFLLVSILPGGPALAGNIIAVEAMDRGAVIRFTLKVVDSTVQLPRPPAGADARLSDAAPRPSDSVG